MVKQNQELLLLQYDSTRRVPSTWCRYPTHMVTGVGSCKDVIDANKYFLPESVADLLVVKFVGEILDTEKLNLVTFTGDQVHHDVLHTRTGLFKVLAPMIKRFIPYTAVFGNHDSEGVYAISRKQTYPSPWDMGASLYLGSKHDS
jgi:hypothetical protein